MRTDGPGQSALLLLDVIEILNSFQVPYAVIGALAASFYGPVRASMDADAIVSLGPDKLQMEKLMSEFKKSGCSVSLRHGDTEDPVAGVINVRDHFSNRVDLLTGIHGMGKDIFSRSVTAAFMGSKIQMIGVEDFIAMKIFAGSPLDLDDAWGVIKISRDKVNFILLRELVQRFGKNELAKLESLLKMNNF